MTMPGLWTQDSGLFTLDQVAINETNLQGSSLPHTDRERDNERG